MKKSRIKYNLIYFANLFVIFSLYAFNSWNGDRDAYESIYYSDGSLTVEFGFGWISEVFRDFGFDYQQFQIIIAFITIFLLSFFIRKNIKNINIFLILYALFFFPLDYVLMRNFLSFSICLVAINFLSNGVKTRFFYVCIVLFAGLIHQSALCFFIFAFIKLDDFFSWKIVYKWLVAFYFSFYLISNYVINYFGFSEHFAIYEVGFISPIYNCAIHVLLVVWIIRLVLKWKENSPRDIFIVNFNFLSLFFLPLYFESEIFVRLIRMVLFLNFCYLSDKTYLKNKGMAALIYLSFFSMYLLFTFLMPTLEFSVFPLVEKNLLINFIFG